MVHVLDVLSLCRVCGYDLGGGWNEKLEPEYEVCPCCGMESGTYDQWLATIVRYRANWLARGAPWLLPRLRPANFDLRKQMEAVLELDGLPPHPNRPDP